MFDGKESSKEYVNLEGNSPLHPPRIVGILMVVASPPGLSRPPFHEAIQLPFRTCGKGESFGPSWSTHWFRITLKIPKHFLEKVTTWFRRGVNGRNGLSFTSIVKVKE